MKRTLLKGTIGGGLILFFWGAISWTVLPWHLMTFRAVKDEGAVARLLEEKTAHDGIHVVPFPAKEHTGAGPLVFLSIRKGGMNPAMGKELLTALITQCFAAFLLTWVTLQTYGLSYRRRVMYVMTLTFTAGVICHIPYWIWWSFSAGYTLVALADVTLAGLFSGLWIAKITGR